MVLNDGLRMPADARCAFEKAADGEVKGLGCAEPSEAEELQIALSEGVDTEDSGVAVDGVTGRRGEDPTRFK